MSFRRRPHQRRLTELGFGDVHVGPTVEQHLHDVDDPRPGGGHEHRLTGHRRRRIWICAGIQQQLDDRDVSIRARERERRHPIVVRRVHRCPSTNQQGRRVSIAEMDGPVEGGPPVRLLRLDIDLLPEQSQDGLRVPALDGFDQPEIVGRHARTGREEQTRHAYDCQAAVFYLHVVLRTYPVYVGRIFRCGRRRV